MIFIKIWLILSILSFVWIGIDLIKHPQMMKIMNIVWMINTLWGGPFIVIAYYWFGRAPKKEKMNMKMDASMSMDGMDMKDMKMSDMSMKDMDMDDMPMPKHKHWQQIASGTLHCGSGCTLADMIGLAISLLLGLGTISHFVLAYILAFIIGIFFQYFALREMDKKTSTKILMKKAMISDFWSLFAWQLGMVVGQLFFQWLLPGRGMILSIFIMQLAMAVGFFFAYPVNDYLVKKGIKKAMA